MSPHQLGVAFVVQYDVLRLEVSVDNSSGMQESQSLYDTASVEPGGAVIKWSSERQRTDADDVMVSQSQTHKRT